jgi:hypothetical protein
MITIMTEQRQRTGGAPAESQVERVHLGHGDLDEQEAGSPHDREHDKCGQPGGGGHARGEAAR